MLGFRNFLTEVRMLHSGPTGKRHVSTYLSPEMINSTTYNTASKAGHIIKGSEVKVHSVHYDASQGKHLATISSTDQPDKKVIVPISQLHKPKAAKNMRGAEDYFTQDLHNQITNSKEQYTLIRVPLD